MFCQVLKTAAVVPSQGEFCQKWDSNPRLQGRLRPERSAFRPPRPSRHVRVAGADPLEGTPTVKDREASASLLSPAAHPASLAQLGSASVS
ncbi:hypothetical protein QQF64_034835 [Cirrhinus molitorella]|uniref:Uncharacterized protein n=1 Tax=Cirrhinus molitorella TaxID=172907 RepID=A0ABR3L4V8_9TELE